MNMVEQNVVDIVHGMYESCEPGTVWGRLSRSKAIGTWQSQLFHKDSHGQSSC
jgi:hypothetical protein